MQLLTPGVQSKTSQNAQKEFTKTLENHPPSDASQFDANR
eukprot:UN19213